MNQSLLFVFIKNFKLLLAVFVLTAIASYLYFNFLITPKYTAETIIYVPNTHANIHLVSAGMRFGYDKEVGEHIEVLNSNYVRNRMIKEFDLGTHYELDNSYKYFTEKLTGRYTGNIGINRSINKSIHITVSDKDAVLAAEMANRLVELADQHKSDIVKANLKIASRAAREDFEKREVLISEMTDSLESLRQSGEAVWTFGEERKSSRYINYEIQYRKELDEYYALKKRYDEFETLLNQEIPKSYVVSEAYAKNKPDYPNKPLITLLSATLSVLLTLVIIKLKSGIRAAR